VVPTGLTTNPPATTAYFFVVQNIEGVNASVILSSSGTSAFEATVVNALSLVFGDVEVTNALTINQAAPYSTNVTYAVSYAIGTSIFDVYLVLKANLITAVSSGTFTIDLHGQGIVFKVPELLNATATLQLSFSDPFIESPTLAPTHILRTVSQRIASPPLATESASPAGTALRNGHAVHTANDQIPTYRPTRYHIIVHRPTGTPSTDSPSWFPYFRKPFWKPSFEPSLSPEDAPSSTPTAIIN
jgi:hypothetical protein